MVPLHQRQRESSDHVSSAPTPATAFPLNTPHDRRAPADQQEYFAEVDEDYILDRFNLTGLNSDVVQEYNRALDLITDSLGQLADPHEVCLS